MDDTRPLKLSDLIGEAAAKSSGDKSPAPESKSDEGDALEHLADPQTVEHAEPVATDQPEDPHAGEQGGETDPRDDFARLEAELAAINENLDTVSTALDDGSIDQPEPVTPYERVNEAQDAAQNDNSIADEVAAQSIDQNVHQNSAHIERGNTAPAIGAVTIRKSMFLRLLVRLQQFINLTFFSSLMRRIVMINMAGLIVLVVGILYFNQWRDGLIEARVQSMRVQGEIIAAAIAASASVDSNVISIDPDRLLTLQGETAVSPLSFFDPALEFPISPERVAPLLGALITPTHTRARIYDKDGLLILDSQSIYAPGEVVPVAAEPTPAPPFWVEWWNRFMTWVPGDQFPLYQEHDGNQGKRYPEVSSALAGAPSDLVRVDETGDLIVSVAVPVKRLRAIVGALLLSTDPGEIDAIVAAERLSVLRIALVAVGVTILLSIFLASTIAGPMRRLSAAAERVQASMSARTQIPDYTDRSDEIGHLSGALRAMTKSLFDRIHAIESFAADVAHELKNPLTSLRSAVETLPLVKTDNDRNRLTSIIKHDVQRLDRLISDISNASRLDAELARDQIDDVDLLDVCQAMVSMQIDKAAERGISLTVSADAPDDAANTHRYLVKGHDIRLAQIVTNLVDNAISFSPDNGQVDIQIDRIDEGNQGVVRIIVRDEGPGIRGDINRIFSRFYTDRPESENFGDHSGLGLSISRQIADAHNGTIDAQNRADRSGAKFTLAIPAARN